MLHQQAAEVIDAVWRIESARLIAGLARIVGDIGLAEDLAQDALVAALEKWPESGVPDNPGAWLMATAKHRAIDHVRRRKMLERKHEHLGRELEERQISPESAIAEAIDDHVGDDLLRLIFTTCHPVLTTDARVALTLRLLGGLTTDEIARAFLQSKTTIQQRIDATAGVPSGMSLKEIDPFVKAEIVKWAEVVKRAPKMARDQIIVMNLCGRGDKDIFAVAEHLGVKL